MLLDQVEHYNYIIFGLSFTFLKFQVLPSPVIILLLSAYTRSYFNIPSCGLHIDRNLMPVIKKNKYIN